MIFYKYTLINIIKMNHFSYISTASANESRSEGFEFSWVLAPHTFTPKVLSTEETNPSDGGGIESPKFKKLI